MWQLLLLLAASVIAEPWGQRDDPRLWADNLVSKFDALPTSGKTTNTPWSDTYWPSMESGIAHRWNSPDPQDFNYDLNTLEQLKAMTADQLKTLSPAEKYDIFLGRYDYPLVHSEWQRTSPDDAGWEGLCHGWAPAAIAYQQPNPVDVTNADGIVIPFGSSDVKALLTYYCAQYDKQGDENFIADRCNYDLDKDKSKASLPACADINAGTYQILLANLLANNSGFVIDRDRSIQVWNQPMYSFSTTVVAQNATSATLSVVSSYAKETYPNWAAHNPLILSETYKYSVDLDENGAITGGSHTTYDRPDFAWMVTPSPFHGYFANLQDIYANSTNDQSHAKGRMLSRAQGQTSRLAEPKGTISLQGPYPDGHHQSWIIAPAQAKEITITFQSVDIERVYDSVRIYEGADGNGALVAVVYGNKVPKQPIVVKSSGALVYFKSSHQVSGMGFHATYTVA